MKAKNEKLFGVIEWIVEQGGTVNIFNEHTVTGIINNMRYRYFITERWIGLKTKCCPPNKSREYTTIKDFIKAVNYYTLNADKNDT